MIDVRSRSWTTALRVAAIILVCSLAVWATVPQGWYMAGSKAAEYEAGVDEQEARWSSERLSEREKTSERGIPHADAGFPGGSVRGEEGAFQGVREKRRRAELGRTVDARR